MDTSRILRAAAAPFLAGLLGLGTAHAASNYTVGNAPDAGDYINAGSLANTLAFTSVTLAADNGVTVAEPVDLSTGIFGPALFDLFLQAPTVSIDGKVTVGAGNIQVNAQTVNLNDILVASDGATLLDQSRLVGSPGITAINLDGAGSLAQATALGLGATAATISVLGGDRPLDSIQAFGNLSAAMSGGSVGGATISGGGLFNWTGGQILEGVLHFSGTFNIYGAGFQIAPWGNCATTPESSWQSAPAQLANQAQCVRGTFADGSTFRTAVTSIGTTNLIGVTVVPVPAAAWLFGGALGLAGVLRRRPPGRR